jgi:hypothetical protein
MPTVEPYTLELWPDRQPVVTLPHVTIHGQPVMLYEPPTAEQLAKEQLPNPIEDLRKDVSELRNEVAELKGMLTAVLIALGNK